MNFVFDLDGTILRGKSDKIEQELKVVLYKLSKVHDLYFATGRDKLGLEKFFYYNPDWYKYFSKKYVYLDGGVTVIGNQTITESPITLSPPPANVDFVLFYPENIVFSSRIACYKYKLLFPNMNLVEFSEYYSISPKRFESKNILKVFLFPRKAKDFDEIKKYIVTYKDCSVEPCKPFGMFVIKGRVDKYFGIRKIIGASDYFMFGDGLNDEMLFLNSVYSVNLGNKDRLKEISDKTIVLLKDLNEELEKWIK
ncbi:HAD family hydrolase [Enterococcus cecorum]|uniref:HAD family hydrolase n=1 Tax=Enterococcus cecorum TaxID=44008 RepID=UPI00215D9B36|nr:HAD family hydrolase [Enterococcus cecorum]